MGTMEVPVGNYILKVSNAEAWSDAEILGVQFAYAGGAAIELYKTTPAELLQMLMLSSLTIGQLKEAKLLTQKAKLPPVGQNGM